MLWQFCGTDCDFAHACGEFDWFGKYSKPIGLIKGHEVLAPFWTLLTHGETKKRPKRQRYLEQNQRKPIPVRQLPKIRLSQFTMTQLTSTRMRLPYGRRVCLQWCCRSCWWVACIRWRKQYHWIFYGKWTTYFIPVDDLAPQQILSREMLRVITLRIIFRSSREEEEVVRLTTFVPYNSLLWQRLSTCYPEVTYKNASCLKDAY